MDVVGCNKMQGPALSSLSPKSQGYNSAFHTTVDWCDGLLPLPPQPQTSLSLHLSYSILLPTLVHGCPSHLLMLVGDQVRNPRSLCSTTQGAGLGEETEAARVPKPKAEVQPSLSLLENPEVELGGRV